MLLLTAIVLAVFVLPAPWNVLVVVGALFGEIAEVFGGIWYSRRRQVAIGVEGMVGGRARVVEECRPEGAVSFKGERWGARCEAGAKLGERVRVEAVEGLTLVVSPILEDPELERTRGTLR